MVVKVKEKFEKTRDVKKNDKFKKYILRGQRNVRYHERILSKKEKSYNFTTELCTRKHMTSVAKDHILNRHQSPTYSPTKSQNYKSWGVNVFYCIHQNI